jgi:hypothetical protein
MIIKLKYIVFFLIIILNSQSFSNILIYGGINISSVGNLTDNDSKNESVGVGFNLNANYEFKVLDNLSLLSGISFDQRGEYCKTYCPFGGASEYFGLISSYLQFPLFIQIDFPFSICSFNFSMGPELGYLLKAIDYNNDGADYSDNLNSFDVGFSLGLGFETSFGGKSYLIIRPSYYIGFNNIADKENVRKLSNNRTIKIAMGIKYDFGAKTSSNSANAKFGPIK